jgi:hypothetical protein
MGIRVDILGGKEISLISHSPQNILAVKWRALIFGRAFKQSRQIWLRRLYISNVVNDLWIFVKFVVADVYRNLPFSRNMNKIGQQWRVFDVKICKTSYGHLDRNSLNISEVLVFRTGTVKKKHKYCVNYTLTLSFIYLFIFYLFLRIEKKWVPVSSL